MTSFKESQITQAIVKFIQQRASVQRKQKMKRDSLIAKEYLSKIKIRRRAYIYSTEGSVIFANSLDLIFLIFKF